MTEENQPDDGHLNNQIDARATNTPLHVMARSEAFRNLARCVRDPSQLRKQGFGKDATLVDVANWHERHIESLRSLTRSDEALEAIARAILKARFYDCEPDLYDGLDDFFASSWEDNKEEVLLEARAALNVILIGKDISHAAD